MPAVVGASAAVATVVLLCCVRTCIRRHVTRRRRRRIHVSSFGKKFKQYINETFRIYLTHSKTTAPHYWEQIQISLMMMMMNFE
jgi:hypothetical protein